MVFIQHTHSRFIFREFLRHLIELHARFELLKCLLLLCMLLALPKIRTPLVKHAPKLGQDVPEYAEHLQIAHL
jgi:hypothetical protein